MEKVSENSFTRTQLYNLVWSKPVSKILEEYALSLTAFKNVCKENDIPLPSYGYWSKLRHQKDVVVIPLPKSEKEYKDILMPIRKEGEENLSKLSELNLLVREIKNDKTLPLIVSEILVKPDPLILAAKKDFKTSKEISWYPMEGLYGTTEGVFNIYVSKELIKRALLFTDALIKLLKARGHDVAVRTNQHMSSDNGTKVIIDGEPFEVCVKEMRKRIQVKSDYSSWMETKYVPTGILTFRIEETPKCQWSDSIQQKLETKLAEILAGLELRAKGKKEDRIDNEKWHREYQLKKKIEEDLKQRKSKELDDFKAIINQSSRWQKSMDLRNYIQVIEQNALKNGNLTKKLQTWLLWIKDKADWYDPLVEKDDELFEDVDRDTLSEIRRSFWES